MLAETRRSTTLVLLFAGSLFVFSSHSSGKRVIASLSFSDHSDHGASPSRPPHGYAYEDSDLPPHAPSYRHQKTHLNRPEKRNSRMRSFEDNSQARRTSTTTYQSNNQPDGMVSQMSGPRANQGPVDSHNRPLWNYKNAAHREYVPNSKRDPHYEKRQRLKHFEQGNLDRIDDVQKKTCYNRWNSDSELQQRQKQTVPGNRVRSTISKPTGFGSNKDESILNLLKGRNRPQENFSYPKTPSNQMRGGGGDDDYPANRESSLEKYEDRPSYTHADDGHDTVKDYSPRSRSRDSSAHKQSTEVSRTVSLNAHGSCRFSGALRTDALFCSTLHGSFEFCLWFSSLPRRTHTTILKQEPGRIPIGQKRSLNRHLDRNISFSSSQPSNRFVIYSLVSLRFELVCSLSSVEFGSSATGTCYFIERDSRLRQNDRQATLFLINNDHFSHFSLAFLFFSIVFVHLSVCNHFNIWPKYLNEREHPWVVFCSVDCDPSVKARERYETKTIRPIEEINRKKGTVSLIPYTDKYCCFLLFSRIRNASIFPLTTVTTRVRQYQPMEELVTTIGKGIWSLFAKGHRRNFLYLSIRCWHI